MCTAAQPAGDVGLKLGGRTVDNGLHLDAWRCGCGLDIKKAGSSAVLLRAYFYSISHAIRSSSLVFAGLRQNALNGDTLVDLFELDKKTGKIK